MAMAASPGPAGADVLLINFRSCFGTSFRLVSKIVKRLVSDPPLPAVWTLSGQDLQSPSRTCPRQPRRPAAPPAPPAPPPSRPRPAPAPPAPPPPRQPRPSSPSLGTAAVAALPSSRGLGLDRRRPPCGMGAAGLRWVFLALVAPGVLAWVTVLATPASVSPGTLSTAPMGFRPSSPRGCPVPPGDTRHLCFLAQPADQRRHAHASQAGLSCQQVLVLQGGSASCSEAPCRRPHASCSRAKLCSVAAVETLRAGWASGLQPCSPHHERITAGGPGSGLGQCKFLPRYPFAKPKVQSNRSEFAVGTAWTYECLPGYKRKTFQTFCLDSSEWTDVQQHCQRKLCVSPKDLVHGSVFIHTGVEFGATITYSCDDGYRLIGAPNATCVVSGNSVLWDTDPPLCESIPCVDPPAISNGELVGVHADSFTYGMVVRYRCRVGRGGRKLFELVGPAVIYCTSKDNWVGEWSSPVPRCVPLVRCPFPEVKNGDMRAGFGRSFSFNESVVFACLPGFSLEGHSISWCQADGRWGPPLPTCLPAGPCVDPPAQLPNGSVVVPPSLQRGAELSFACDAGFRLRGAPTSRCVAEGAGVHWSSEFPSCEPVSCDPPPEIENGLRNHPQGVFPLHAVVRYRCLGAFRLIGDNVLFCSTADNVTGVWDKPAPRCELFNRRAKCEDPVVPGSWRDRRFRPPYRHSDSVTFNCHKNFTLRGNKTVWCQANSTWGPGPLPVCESDVPLECPPLPAVPHGHHTGQSLGTFAPGLTVTYSCEPGYLLRGTTTVQCLSSGHWTPTPPTCREARCPSPGPFPNGQVEGPRNLSVGNAMTFRCNPGYWLQGQPSSQCVLAGQQATWTRMPVCEEIRCPPLPPIPHGSHTGRPGVSPPYGSTVNYTCDPDPEDGVAFVLRGARTLVCTSDGQRTGQWSGPAPRCELAGPTPPCPAPRVRRGRVLAGLREHYSYNDTVRFACEAGFSLRGSPGARCTARGTWEPAAPVCERECEAPPEVAHGHREDGGRLRFPPGTAVTYRCMPGHVLEGEEAVRCSPDGEWTPAAPWCRVAECEPAGQQLFERPRGQFIRLAVNSSCEEGYRLGGSMYQPCRGPAPWFVEMRLCEEITCPPPPAIANGLHTGSASEEAPYGATVTYACGPGPEPGVGFQLVGEPVLRCTSLHGRGVWSGPAPTCRLALPTTQCPPVRVAQGRVSGRGGPHAYNDSVAVHCDAGFTLKGSGRIRCLANGTWDPPVPTCEKGCGPPTGPLHGWHSGAGQALFVPGTRVEFGCDPGFSLAGSASSSCEPSGTWSPPAPQCEETPCRPVGEELQRVPPGSHVVTVNTSCSSAGFQLVGYAYRQCQDAGSGPWFQRLMRCEAVLCQPPPAISHGRHSGAPGKPVLFGHEVSYKCDQGFSLVGAPAIRCERSAAGRGSWSGPPPRCQPPTHCPALEARPGRRLSGAGPPYSHNDRVLVTCAPGFIMNGSGEIRCHSAGAGPPTWVPGVPTCIRKGCHRPALIPYGNHTGGAEARFSPGMSVLYSCEQGYLLVGDPLLLCTHEGVWNQPPPACKERGRPARLVPSTPAAVRRLRLCSQEDPGASRGPQRCLEVTAEAPGPKHGGQWKGNRVRERCGGRGGVRGRRLLGLQDPLAWHRGAAQRDASAEVNCSFPAHELGAQRGPGPGSVFQYGAIVTVECEDGYTLEGSSQSQCQDDHRWDPPLASCRSQAWSQGLSAGFVLLICLVSFLLCKTLKHRERNYRTSTGPKEGELGLEPRAAHFVDPYSLAGEALLAVLALLALLALPAAQGEKRKRRERGERVRQGMVGAPAEPPGVRQGMWDAGQPPTATVAPARPSAHWVRCPGEGHLRLQRLDAARGDVGLLSYQHRPQARSSDMHPHRAHAPGATPHAQGAPWGTGRLKGQHVWEPLEMAVAQRPAHSWGLRPAGQCETPEQLPSARLKKVPEESEFPVGAKLKYVCRPGFLGMPFSITCLQNHTWSVPNRCIRRRCPNPGDLVNGNMLIDGDITFGSTITYSCNDGFRLIGESSLMCILMDNTVGWDNDPPLCERIPCGQPPQIANGYFVSSDRDYFFYGSVVTYYCNHPEDRRMRPASLVGEKSIFCTSKDNRVGVWSGPAPQCLVPNTCTPPAVEPGVLVSRNRSLYNLGETVTLQCPPGFVMAGLARVSCQAQNRWGPELPTCSREEACAAFQDRLPNGRVHPPHTLGLGARVEFACNEGFRLEGPRASYCVLQGASTQWNSSAPACKRISCSPPPDIPHGRHSGHAQADFPYGAAVTYACDPRPQGGPAWELQGPSTLRCTSDSAGRGVWSGPAPRCEPTGPAGFCQPPGDLPFAQPTAPRQELEFPVGTALSYQCRRGYTGAAFTITCLEGLAWSGAKGRCQPPCARCRFTWPVPSAVPKPAVQCPCPVRCPSLQSSAGAHGRSPVSVPTAGAHGRSPVSSAQRWCPWPQSSVRAQCGAQACSPAPMPSVVSMPCACFLRPVSGTGAHGRCRVPMPVSPALTGSDPAGAVLASTGHVCIARTPAPRRAEHTNLTRLILPLSRREVVRSAPCAPPRDGACEHRHPVRVDGQLLLQRRVSGSSASRYQLRGARSAACLLWGHDVAWDPEAPSCEGESGSLRALRSPVPTAARALPALQKRQLWLALGRCALPGPRCGIETASRGPGARPTGMEPSCSPGPWAAPRPPTPLPPLGTERPHRLHCPRAPASLRLVLLHGQGSARPCLLVSRARLHADAPRGLHTVQRPSPKGLGRPGKPGTAQTDETLDLLREIICAAPPAIGNGTHSGGHAGAFPYGAAVTYACDPRPQGGPAWELQGPSTLRCTSDGAGRGVWSGPAPRCEPTGPAGPTGHSAGCRSPLAQGRRWEGGAGLVRRCLTILLVFGDRVPVCPQPPETPHGQLVDPHGPPHRPGMAVTFTCDPGYLLVGRALVFCTDRGTWSALTHRCREVNCSLPQRLDGVQKELQGERVYRYGDSVTLGCGDGYTLEGSPHSRCQADGTWAPPLALCTPSVSLASVFLVLAAVSCWVILRLRKGREAPGPGPGQGSWGACQLRASSGASTECACCRPPAHEAVARTRLRPVTWAAPQAAGQLLLAAPWCGQGPGPAGHSQGSGRQQALLTGQGRRCRAGASWSRLPLTLR
ncbi:Complement receptor type 2 [Galemys pyrenaicus]|uniref:Complement receptor type 2 n=1 Tax=Galemys pyrenaicus TaxID=202257 RepID=A0A8J5ZMW1_GALPY|nr:Complement receptor type 2 [Galemys pyrenaicus]